METFEKCVAKLQSDISDSEKIAVLMVLAKILPNLKVDKKLANRLYNAIGETFVLKMLRLDVTSSENNHAFQRLGLLIISAISKHDNTTVSKNDVLIEEIFSLLSRVKRIGRDENIIESLELLKIITAYREYLSKVFLEKYIHILDFLSNPKFSTSAVGIIINLITHKKFLTERIETVLLTLSKKYSETEEIDKFYLLDALNALLENVVTLNQVNFGMAILKNICHANLNILSSKCQAKYKKSVLRMMSLLLKLFDQSSVYTCHNNSKRFTLTLLTCTSVELAIGLENFHFEGETENVEILACLEITLSAIELIASEKFLKIDLSNDNDFIIKVFTCFKNIMTSVYQFIRDSAVKRKICLDHPVIKKCIILVCVWSTEETSSLQDELKSSLPIILKSVDDQLKTGRDNNDVLTDVMNFVVPCLSQVIADENFSTVLIKHKMIPITSSYFQSLLDKPVVMENVSHMFKESLVNLLLQTILLFPTQSDVIVSNLNIDTLTYHLVSEIHNSNENFYSIQLVAFYFCLLKGVKNYSPTGEKLVAILENFFSISLKTFEEGEKDMWIIALQNILEHVNRKTIKITEKSNLNSLIKRRLEESNNIDRNLLTSFTKSLKLS